MGISFKTNGSKLKFMMNKEAKKNYIEEMKKNFSSNEAVLWLRNIKDLNVTELDELEKTIKRKRYYCLK